MRKLMLVALLFITVCKVAVAQKNEKSFEIDGKLGGVKNGAKIFLLYWDGEKNVSDSTILENGHFKFAGKVDDFTMASIERNEDTQEFFLEPSAHLSIIGADTIANATISGGKTQTDYLRLKKNLEPLTGQEAMLVSQFRPAFQAKDTAKVKLIRPKLNLCRAEIQKAKNDFIMHNGDSKVSLYLLQDQSANMDVSTFKPLYNSLTERLKNTPYGKNLGLRLGNASKVVMWAKAVDFTLNDTKGKPVTLSQFKGKYVLIDFWASWCENCRAENPDFVKAYDRFKDKNFEIIGVSLDTKKEPWLKAVEMDKLEWINVCELAKANTVAAQYDAVSAIPQNFLVDPNGNIVAKNIRGREIEKKLESILGNSDQSKKN